MTDQTTVEQPVAEYPQDGEQPAMRPGRVRQRSRYDRPRRYVSWVGLLLGVIIGVSGALYYTWVIDEVRIVDTAPWQLNEFGRNQYLVAIMLRYAHDGNLEDTIAALSTLRLPGDDPIQQVADVACHLASTGYVSSNSGLRAIQSMMVFYQNQGRAGCADTLIPLEPDNDNDVIQIELPTPTLPPVPTKSPTPEITRPPTATQPPFIPTEPPPRAYELVGRSSFCSEQFPGVIEVRVVDFNAQETPGQPVRVRWADGESTFFTGLKPERGAGYADFEMEAGFSYIIEMPGLSDPSTTPLVASECILDGGATSITSYRVTFQGG